MKSKGDPILDCVALQREKVRSDEDLEKALVELGWNEEVAKGAVKCWQESITYVKEVK